MKYVTATLASAAAGWFVSDVLNWNMGVNLFVSTLVFGLTVLWVDGQFDH